MPKARGGSIRYAGSQRRQDAADAWNGATGDAGTCGPAEAAILLAAQLSQQLQMQVAEAAVASYVARSPCGGQATLKFDDFIGLLNGALSAHMNGELQDAAEMPPKAIADESSPDSYRTRHQLGQAGRQPHKINAKAEANT